MRRLPIPFSPTMIDALMREIRQPGTGKTQTRRAIPQDVVDAYCEYDDWCRNVSAGVPTSRQWEKEFFLERCRYAVGDLLWVRETYYQFGHWEPVPGVLTKGGKQKWAFVPDAPAIEFEMRPPWRGGFRPADPYTPAWHKRLGRFMPKAASRITLRVTGVKVERLQDISEADAVAEGVEAAPDFPTSVWRCYMREPKQQDWWGDPRESFRTLWESINGAGSWARNDWVAAYTFEPIFKNIDRVLA